MKKWTETDVLYLRNNYSEHGLEFCAKLLKRSKSSIQHKAQKLHLKVNHETLKENHRQATLNHPGKSNININTKLFTENFTKESSYILGFLWADGYLNNKSQSYRICLEILEKDMKDIIKLFKSTGKWQTYQRTRTNRRRQSSMITNSKILYNFLCQNDYDIKSTNSADKIINIIPKKIQKYWWRGYFDGDGCFYINEKNSCYQFTACGSYDQDWSFLESLLKKINVNYKIIRRIQNTHRHSVVRVTSLQNVISVGKYIYSGYDNIGLKRKYQKYLKIKSHSPF